MPGAISIARRIAAPALFLVAALVITGAMVTPAAAAPPRFSPEVATEAPAGHVKLSWNQASPGAEVAFELETARTADFSDAHLHVRTGDRQSFVSGLANGIHYFRVRAASAGQTSQWSPAIAVKVQHPTLLSSVAFFAVGALVFLLTVAFIVTGGFGAVSAERSRRS